MVDVQGAHPLCQWVQVRRPHCGQDSDVDRGVPLLCVQGELTALPVKRLWLRMEAQLVCPYDLTSNSQEPFCTFQNAKV